MFSTGNDYFSTGILYLVKVRMAWIFLDTGCFYSERHITLNTGWDGDNRLATSDYVCSSMEMHPSHSTIISILCTSSSFGPHHWTPLKFEAEAVFGWLHNGSFIFLREFLKKLCYTLTTNLTGLIETKSSGSDYISLYHVQSTLISKSKFHRLVSETD